MVRTLRSLTMLTAVTVLLVAGCGSDDTTEIESASTDADGSSTTVGSGLEGTITVSAAASLRDGFTAIGDDFTAANPGVEVAFNFDSSARLSTQILEGAPADVFASADEATMTTLTEHRLVAGAPEIFAANELVIVTKPGNPEGITGLADLADAGVISLCGEEVPCGRYATEALDEAGVVISESSITRGQNATATLTAVAEGDAVAGIVYVTDATSVGDTVATVVIPPEMNVIATYPIGVLRASGNTEVAQALMAHVLNGEGQAVLAEFGFLPPA